MPPLRGPALVESGDDDAARAIMFRKIATTKEYKRLAIVMPI
jgi:hypothetical protein